MNISPFVSSGGVQRTPVMQAKAPPMENPGDREREVKGETTMGTLDTEGPRTPLFVTPHIGNLHDSSSDEEVQTQTQHPQQVMSREVERYSETAFPALRHNTLSPPSHPSPHYEKDVMYDLQQQVSSIAGKLGDLEKREMVQNKV